jgi:hypothetical protein
VGTGGGWNYLNLILGIERNGMRAGGGGLWGGTRPAGRQGDGMLRCFCPASRWTAVRGCVGAPPAMTQRVLRLD